MIAWQFVDVAVAYGAGRFVLDGVNFTVRAGERVGIAAPSGAGKSTLIRAGLGLLPLNRGDVYLFGQNTRAFSWRDWRLARRQVQWLPQDPLLLLPQGLPVGLALRASLRTVQPDVDAAEVAESLLAAVGLRGRGRALPQHLSGGERRRAGLARILCARPSLAVVDEPTSGVDAALALELIDTIRDVLPAQATLVAISHDLALLVRTMDRILFLAEGELVDDLPAAAVFDGAGPAHPIARNLVAAERGRP